LFPDNLSGEDAYDQLEKDIAKNAKPVATELNKPSFTARDDSAYSSFHEYALTEILNFLEEHWSDVLTQFLKREKNIPIQTWWQEQKKVEDKQLRREVLAKLTDREKRVLGLK